MIKYLGSKKRLVPFLGELYSSSKSLTSLDLFTGTTRVAQELKKRGSNVTAVDKASYSKVFAECHIATDLSNINIQDVVEALDYLSNIKGEEGYFTRTFCIDARYFQPFNGEKIDAIRSTIDTEFKNTPLYSILLTSLIYAADKVDSTTGVQMAYLKSWAPRSYNTLSLEIPQMYYGSGEAIQGDANIIIQNLPNVDFAYLDPPYNQHSYYGNYHIWETLVKWDAPDSYGIANKREDVRDTSNKSIFNSKKTMPEALTNVMKSVQAEVVVLSYNNESWFTEDELLLLCKSRGEVELFSFDSKRYVGAQIGIHDTKGNKVGQISHVRNLEYVIVCGDRSRIDSIRKVLI